MVGRLGGCEPRVSEVIEKIQKNGQRGGPVGGGWIDLNQELKLLKCSRGPVGGRGAVG